MGTDTSSSSSDSHSSSSIFACWVPLRIRNNAIEKWKNDRGKKPFIGLWQEISSRGDDLTNMKEQSPKKSSPESPPVVLGRREFLETMKAACGCQTVATRTKTSSSSSFRPDIVACCQKCLAVKSWADTRLSREMIRIHKKHMQIRGVNAKLLVRLNHQFVTSSELDDKRHCGDEDNNTNDWTGNIPLEEGSILTLGSEQQEEDVLLKFKLVYIDLFKNNNCPLQSRLNESSTKLKSAKVSEKESNVRKQKQIVTSSDNTTFSSKGKFGIDWSNPTIALKPQKRSKPKIPLVSKTMDEVSQRKDTGMKDTQQNTTTTCETSHSSSSKKRDDSKKSDIRVKPYVLFFLALGQSMPPLRIQKLKTAARERCALVVDKWDVDSFPRPTHMVLDGTLSAQAVGSKLGFSREEDLAKCLTKYSIETVTPDWIAFSGVGNKTLGEPTMKQLWAGRPRFVGPSSPPKRKRIVDEESPSSSSSSKDNAKRNRNDTTIKRVNVGLSEMFAKLAKLHQDCPLRDDDLWKGYMNSLISGRLRHLDFEVTDDEEILRKVHATKGFGESTVNKIREYLRTGTCQKITEFESDPERIAMNTMMHIWGVGKTMARKLVLDMGLKTLDEVKAAVSSGQVEFSQNQLIGLDCWEDFREKMKRTEVEKVGEIVEKATLERFPSAQVTIMGSYRRGKPTSGDIDILILVPEFVKTTPRGAIDELVERLRRQGHISHHLSKVRLTKEDTCREQQIVPITGTTHIATYPSSQSYMGVFMSPVFPGKRRRIDIKMYPFRERIFASIYFTGNGWFNRSIRLYATRLKGLSLNDHGIFPANAESNVPRPEEDLLLDAKSDKDVFDFLGLVYKTANERDCFDAVLPKDESFTKSLANLEYSRGEIKYENHQWIE